MTTPALRESLRELAASIRLHEIVPQAEFEAGLVHLETEIGRIALDAFAAQSRGVSLSEATSDFVNFPQLARLHAAVDDVLTLSLPAPVVAWLKPLLLAPEPPSFNEMRTALVVAAADAEIPQRRALAWFLLFEGVRLNLVIMTKWFPQETLGVGVEIGDLNAIAEARVAEWLAERPAVPSLVRPFHIIVAAAVQALNEHAELLRTQLAPVQRDLIEAMQERARFEEILDGMDVRDALLIRRELSTYLDEPLLTVEHLQERHGLVLGGVSRNALDQRSRRLHAKTPDARRRRGVALLDLLSAAAGGVQ